MQARQKAQSHSPGKIKRCDMIKRTLQVALLAVFLTPTLAEIADAGPVGRACLTSPRKAKSVRLCSCIDSVAKQSLSRGDQRLAAKFFRKPQRAQDIRQSDSRHHERFWQKYKAFGTRVEATCG